MGQRGAGLAGRNAGVGWGLSMKSRVEGRTDKGSRFDIYLQEPYRLPVRQTEMVLR